MNTSDCEWVYIEYVDGESTIFHHFDNYERWMDNPWSVVRMIELNADGSSTEV